jgi:hypothetical protein
MPKATLTLPPAEYLHQCFEYNSETGELRWRYRPREHFGTDIGFRAFNSQFPGRVAGSPNAKGYLTVRLGNGAKQISRIIYKMHHGIDPKQIDHKDRNRTNNKLGNLRSVTILQNNRNMIKSPGKTGFVGVSQFEERWHRKRFYAVIRNHAGKKTYLGSFHTAEEAHSAYRDAANRIFDEFSPFRK